MDPSLECPDCGATPTESGVPPWRCECGHPLEYQTAPDPPPNPIEPRFSPSDGVWAFADFIPVERRVSLGEGLTPEVDAEPWAASFKLEYVMPTGSYKDRGTTVMLSELAAAGADSIFVDSSGNAGSSIANYAILSGLDATIYAPNSITPPKRAAIEDVGAEVVTVPGPREAVTDACREAVESSDGTYATHAWRPSFLAGTQTVAFEMAAHRDWRAPDAVVMPLAAGTLFLGAYRGFEALESAGWIDSTPTLYAVQAAGYAPVVAGVGGDPSTGGDNTLVSHTNHPPRRSALIDAVTDSGGDAVAVTETETRDTLQRVRGAGYYVEPTSAIGVAGLEAFRSAGEIAPEDDVVVPLTGSGLKA